MSIRTRTSGIMVPAYVASATFTATGVNFDGTNDFMKRTNIAGPPADSKVMTFSCWLNFAAAGDGAQQWLIIGPDSRFSIRKTTTNLLLFKGNTSAPAETFSVRQKDANALTSANGWTNILCSCDLASTTVNLYFDDVDVKEPGDQVANNNNINWASSGGSETRFGVATDDASEKLNADVAEFYMHLGAYLDFSNSANRRKFISAGGAPVSLGADGSTPTGSQPTFYFRGPAVNWNTNLGTGGNFTVTGTLTDSATNPP